MERRRKPVERGEKVVESSGMREKASEKALEKYWKGSGKRWKNG